MSEREAVVQCRDLSVVFGRHQVLKHVDIDLFHNSVFGLVGESGSGKTTLAKALVGMVRPASGTIRVLGEEIGRLSGRKRRAFARRVQLVPQDPYSSLNPRRTIAQALAEALDPVQADPKRYGDRIDSSLSMLGIDPESKHRFPHEFSGGQRQRIAIARALVVEPQLIIADEITSALDVVVPADVIETLKRLRCELSLSMLFVTHNLAVAQDLCDEIAVMQSGRIVEQGTVDRVFHHPADPYTQHLLDSVPGSPGFTLDPSRRSDV